jgi:hypothetical protein
MGKYERPAVMIGVSALLFAMLCLMFGYRILALPVDLQACLLIGYIIVWTCIHLGFKKLEAKKITASDQASR